MKKLIKYREYFKVNLIKNFTYPEDYTYGSICVSIVEGLTNKDVNGRRDGIIRFIGNCCYHSSIANDFICLCKNNILYDFIFWPYAYKEEENVIDKSYNMLFFIKDKEIIILHDWEIREGSSMNPIYSQEVYRIVRNFLFEQQSKNNKIKNNFITNTKQTLILNKKQTDDIIKSEIDKIKFPGFRNIEMD